MLSKKNEQLSYLERKLQGNLNSRKTEFLQSLKERGVFIGCSEERGFVYQTTITVYGEQLKLEIGLKNGEIAIFSINGALHQSAV